MPNPLRGVRRGTVPPTAEKSEYFVGVSDGGGCLYFPANILPIMISSNPAATEANTIFSGIAYMWDEGDRLIAAVIFSASIWCRC
ncbi:PqiA family protein [Neisseria gonorrhoeae]|uniref:PqiA family protein n=1 Tax=Neisseria gonorrhoeae TaxID=485 RepID=A0A378VUT3_NEIGO|nr:PqiA family protein [Neisseria gonorrhoeae]